MGLASPQPLTKASAASSENGGEREGKGGNPTEEAGVKGGAEGGRRELEEEKEMRTIFVGNLPTTFNPKKVKSRFKEYGAIESVRLRSVAVEGMAVDKAGDQVSLSPVSPFPPAFEGPHLFLVFWFSSFRKIIYFCGQIGQGREIR